MVRILLAAILLTPLLSPAAFAGAPASEATIGDFNAPLLGQSWSNDRESNTLDRVGNVRARSLIKLGIFIVTIVGGLIAFLIRMMTGRGRQPAMSSAAASPDATQSLQPLAPNALGQPAPMKPLATTSSSAASSGSSSNVGWIVGLAIAFSICGGGFLVLVAAIFLFAATSWRSAASEDQMMVDQARMMEEFQRAQDHIEASRAAQEKFQQELEERWGAANDQFADAERQFNELAGQIAGGAEDFPPLPDATTVAFEPLDWTDRELVDSGLNIRNQGMSFRDVASDGGVLVGLQVSSHPHRIASLQPIYQIGSRYVLGRTHGKLVAFQRRQLLAPPGYVVSAVRVDLTGRVDAIQLEFAPLIDGQIDLNQTQPSPLVGKAEPKKKFVLESEGDPIVGISGKIQDDFDGFSIIRRTSLRNSETPLALSGKESKPLEPRAGSGRAPNQFSDKAPVGGVLVGMRVFTGQKWQGAIRAVQPIYQVGSEYQLGQRHGPDGGVLQVSMAKPGFAIGAVEARAGLVLNSIRFTFRQADEEGRLSDNDEYVSKRIGSAGGGEFEIDGGGRRLIGFEGMFQTEIVSLQFMSE